jgi:hypothetical protein
MMAKGKLKQVVVTGLERFVQAGRQTVREHHAASR